MSEVEARPPPNRGRSTYRGGRGGFGRGGPRGGSRKPANGTTNDTLQPEDSVEDEGELGDMKKKYASELAMLKDMFPDWTDVDLVFALQETDGDVPATVDHITQGNVSQFAEVKSAKDRARSKVKDVPSAAGAPEKSAVRGGRGRGGLEGTRGGRGRGADRGRGGSRGGRGGNTTTNGTAKDATAASVPTTESSAWDDSSNAVAAESSWDIPAQDGANDAGDTGQSDWANAVSAEAKPAAASEAAKSSLIPESGPRKSWASMFSKPAPVPAQKPPASQPPPAETVASTQAPPAPEQIQEVPEEPEPLPTPPMIQEPPVEAAAIEPDELPVEQGLSSAEEDLTLTPSKDPLTEANVEHLPDESIPPSTQTAASTTGSIDPRNLTPMPTQQAPIGRPPMGGYATSAYRATGQPGRSASFNRRLLDQQEALIMPDHSAVDRTAVVFGSMGLNGEPGPDVDEDREEAETRQAPQHSPPSQPKTSLPPAPRQMSAMQEPGMPESLPTPKAAPGLPPASTQNQQQTQEASLTSSMANEPSQMSQNYGPYGRYGHPIMQQQESTAPAQQPQKPYDPFSHQAQPSQYDQYGMQSQQAPQQQQPQHQQQSQSAFNGLSSAPNDYSSYYTTDQQQRSAYNSNYYGGNFGQQDGRSQAALGQSHQDTGMGQQRSASGFGAGPHEQAAFSSQAQQQAQAQSRYADAPGSGHNTPNPLMGGQQQTGPTAQQQQQQQHSMQQQAPSHHQQQPQQQQQGGYATNAAGFPYGHPYYNSPYAQAYQNQFGQPYQPQMGSYGGGGYPSKQQQQQSGMYGGSQHGYGMAPQSSYEQHSASPANAGAFGQNQQSSMRSSSGMSSGLGGLEDYGRSAQQHPAAHQQNTAFDVFARSASGLGTQGGYGQQSMGPSEDSLKPLSENKNGPSPAFGQPGRPGSAANNPNSAQSGLPPPQSHQSGAFAGYPGFPSQSQYGGLGGLGSQQQQQQQHGQQSAMGGQAGYGSYGQGGGFPQTYGQGYGSRGGWGSQYGAH